MENTLQNQESPTLHWNVDDIVKALGTIPEHREGAFIFRIGGAALTVYPAAGLLRYTAGSGDAGQGDAEVTLRRVQPVSVAEGTVVFGGRAGGWRHEVTARATGEIDVAVRRVASGDPDTRPATQQVPGVS